MRSKTPLVLMEQALMVLVFSLAAVLCLQAFVWSDTQSAQRQARDEALLQAQSAAEVLKAYRGDLTQVAQALDASESAGILSIAYDDNWEKNTQQTTYLLHVKPESSHQPYLAQAQVWVEALDGGETLCALTVRWQEVDGNG